MYVRIYIYNHDMQSIWDEAVQPQSRQPHQKGEQIERIKDNSPHLNGPRKVEEVCRVSMHD